MRNGFTLIEILLVVAAIAILAGIVILAINPSKQLGDTRNAKRRADVNTILNAVYQYTIDTGSVVDTITADSTEICIPESDCSNLIDLSVLVEDQTYLADIPQDPTGSSDNHTGYFISQSTNGRITVSAPHAEQGDTISVTR